MWWGRCARAAIGWGVTVRWQCSSGDLLAILSTGAYCMAMASNYNTRGRAAEVLVDGSRAHVIRKRETAADQMALERLVK